jgi:hypothetical protein
MFRVNRIEGIDDLVLAGRRLNRRAGLSER